MTSHCPTSNTMRTLSTVSKTGLEAYINGKAPSKQLWEWRWEPKQVTSAWVQLTLGRNYWNICRGGCVRWASVSDNLEVCADSWGGVGGAYIFKETTLFLTTWLCVGCVVYFLIPGLWKQLGVCLWAISCQVYLIKMSLTLKLHIYAVLTSAWWQSSHI